MKRKFKSLLMLMVIIPFAFLLCACGGVKSLNGKTYVYNRIETTGTVKADDYVNEYKSLSLVFGESTVDYAGSGESATFDYKMENGKLYLKDSKQSDYPTNASAEISGKYLIITDIVSGGTIKVYLKVK